MWTLTRHFFTQAWVVDEKLAKLFFNLWGFKQLCFLWFQHRRHGAHRLLVLLWVPPDGQERRTSVLALHVLDDRGDLRVLHGLGDHPSLRYGWRGRWRTFSLVWCISVLVWRFCVCCWLLFSRSKQEVVFPKSQTPNEPKPAAGLKMSSVWRGGTPGGCVKLMVLMVCEQVGGSAWAQSSSSTAGGCLSSSQRFLPSPLWLDSPSCLRVLASCWRWVTLSPESSPPAVGPGSDPVWLRSESGF